MTVPDNELRGESVWVVSVWYDKLSKMDGESYGVNVVYYIIIIYIIIIIIIIIIIGLV